MSALRQKRSFLGLLSLSALPPIAHIKSDIVDVASCLGRVKTPQRQKQTSPASELLEV
jgi:hypothetical protein